ncbi:MAG TPA: hypothetical protein VIY48_10565 [Candidatus Paceibacterota bacterium]
MYNLDDPEDAARFHLNMLCGELANELRDYVNHFGHDKVEPAVLSKFADVAVAIKKLDQATTPKGVENAA